MIRSFTKPPSPPTALSTSVAPSQSVAKAHHFIEPLIAYAICIALKAREQEPSRMSVPQQGGFNQLPNFSMTSHNMPEDREYTPSHEWVRH